MGVGLLLCTASQEGRWEEAGRGESLTAGSTVSAGDWGRPRQPGPLDTRGIVPLVKGHH